MPVLPRRVCLLGFIATLVLGIGWTLVGTVVIPAFLLFQLDRVLARDCGVRRTEMDTNDKHLLLGEHLAHFRTWTYDALAAEIDRTANDHDCLYHIDRVFDDGTEYQIEFNVFWDDEPGGDVRVIGDITIMPQRPLLGFLPVYTPDATDSFIMASDGSFIGE